MDLSCTLPQICGCSLSRSNCGDLFLGRQDDLHILVLFYTSCQSAIQEINHWLNKCNNIQQENQSLKSDLFKPRNLTELLPWVLEQENYHNQVLKEVGHAKDELEKAVEGTQKATAKQH